MLLAIQNTETKEYTATVIDKHSGEETGTYTYTDFTKCDTFFSVASAMRTVKHFEIDMNTHEIVPISL